MSIIKKVLITEKSSNLLEKNKYTFVVNDTVSKIEFKQYLKTLFNLNVTDINSILCKGKTFKRKNISFKKSNFKKFIVSFRGDDDLSPLDNLFKG